MLIIIWFPYRKRKIIIYQLLGNILKIKLRIESYSIQKYAVYTKYSLGLHCKIVDLYWAAQFYYSMCSLLLYNIKLYSADKYVKYSRTNLKRVKILCEFSSLAWIMSKFFCEFIIGDARNRRIREMINDNTKT